MFLCFVSVAFDKPLFDEYFDQQKIAAEEFGSQQNTSGLRNGIRRAKGYLSHGVHTKPWLTPLGSTFVPVTVPCRLMLKADVP